MNNNQNVYSLIMKYSLHVSIFSFLVIFFFSCRQIPDEDFLSDEFESPIAINMKLSENKWESNNEDNTQQAEYKSITDIGNNEFIVFNSFNRSVEALDNGLAAVEIEEIPNHVMTKLIASQGNNSLVSAVPGEPVQLGIRYGLVIYKKNENGNYIWDKNYEFVTGDGSIFFLDGDRNYTIILYSINSKTLLPEVKNKHDINSVYIDAKDAHDILYQRIDNVIPNGNLEKNYLEIHLQHLSTGIIITVDTSDIFGGFVGGNQRNINYITNATVQYQTPSDLKLNLGNANFSHSEDTTITKTVNITNFKNEFGSTSKTSDLSSIVRLPDGNQDVTLSFRIRVQGIAGAKTLTTNIKRLVKYRHKQTFVIRPMKCGAYVKQPDSDETIFRQFMCHNIGANYDSNYISPSKNIHGGKYHWGRSESDYEGHLSQFQDQLYPDWNCCGGWGNVPIKPLNSWQKTYSGGDNNICPIGYRVPTLQEFTDIENLNNLVAVGPWNEDIYNYSSGIKYGESLFFPAAGYRPPKPSNINDNIISSRGSSVLLWTLDSAEDQENGIFDFPHYHAVSIESGNISPIILEARNGLPVRCISHQ